MPTLNSETELIPAGPVDKLNVVDGVFEDKSDIEIEVNNKLVAEEHADSCFLLESATPDGSKSNQLKLMQIWHNKNDTEENELDKVFDLIKKKRKKELISPDKNPSSLKKSLINK